MVGFAGWDIFGSCFAHDWAKLGFGGGV